MIIANSMSVIPVACLSEMKDEINALCNNILCIMLESGFKPKE